MTRNYSLNGPGLRLRITYKIPERIFICRRTLYHNYVTQIYIYKNEEKYRRKYYVQYGCYTSTDDPYFSVFLKIRRTLTLLSISLTRRILKIS